jgi:phenylpyruvate tautomerase PptA (4-oxalocrotonate tautomerase family)
LLNVTLTPGSIPADRVDAFIDAITTAACTAESLPVDPLHRSRCVLLLDRREAGSIRWGGQIADGVIRAVFVRHTVSEGVLDPVRRDRFARAVHDAATDASPGDERLLHTSVIFDEVPEGRWGRDGKVVRLPEIASVAGFEHLSAIAGA